MKFTTAALTLLTTLSWGKKVLAFSNIVAPKLHRNTNNQLYSSTLAKGETTLVNGGIAAIEEEQGIVSNDAATAASTNAAAAVTVDSVAEATEATQPTTTTTTTTADAAATATTKIAAVAKMDKSKIQP
jgi:hypothetical protein